MGIAAVVVQAVVAIVKAAAAVVAIVKAIAAVVVIVIGIAADTGMNGMGVREKDLHRGVHRAGLLFPGNANESSGVTVHAGWCWGCGGSQPRFSSAWMAAGTGPSL